VELEIHAAGKDLQRGPVRRLEIRWSLKEGDDWAITASALTSKLWLISHDANNEWQAKEVGTIGDPAKIPLPVDISISADGTKLWVNTFMDGTTICSIFPIQQSQCRSMRKSPQAGQYDFPKLGWESASTSPLHFCNIGTRRVPTTSRSCALTIGRQGFEAHIRGRFLQGKTRPTASYEILGSSYQSLARCPPARGIKVMTIRARVFGALCMDLPLGPGLLWRTGRCRGDRRRPRPPGPGSYTLDHIQPVPFGIVLDGNRFPRMLSHYTSGKITLLAFFYSTCADPRGCPLAWEAFEHVREAILAQPELHGRARLVFLSLDPEHDTPDVLKNFTRGYEASASLVPWYFLTTYSYLFLNPVLRKMGEEISIDREASGPIGSF